MLRAGRLNMSTNAFDNNVYWPGQSTNVTMQAGQKGGSGWAAWRATGADAHSVIADPLFVDAARRDYRLKPDSPARKLGFVDLPYDQMGLQRSRYRPELPKEAEGVREHPEWLTPRPGFLGPIGRKIDAFLSERIFSGAAKDAIFTDVLGDGTGWKASLKPATPRRTDGAWQLTLTKSGVEPVVLDVGDFATAADADDPENAFSIWF